MRKFDLDIKDDETFFRHLGIKYSDKFFFFYDETNNCRKFWIKEDGKFNTNYDEDFVLGGVSFEDKIPKLERAELARILNLQKNTDEIKFNRHFASRTFLDCVGKRRTRDFLRWLSEQELYIHYFNVNNMYYAIVEIFDSITEPEELDEYGFDYFEMKSVMFDLLRSHPEELQMIMSRVHFPNIEKNKIPYFCDAIISLFPQRYNCTIEEKYLMGCLKRAKEEKQLFFLENNIDFIMQENYMEFYIDPIRTYVNSSIVFDEEKKIQEILGGYELVRGEEPVNSFSFINSKDNAWIQVADVVVGILGKMFIYANQNTMQTMITEIDNYTDLQLESVYLIDKLRSKANTRNRGFLHSIAPTKTVKRIDNYLTAVNDKYRDIKGNS